MPNFLITSPDGRKFNITAPDGATQEDAINYAKNNLGNNSPANPAASQNPSSDLSFLNSEGGGTPTVLGMPVDAVNSALKTIGLGSDAPIGGSKNIASIMRSVNIGPRENEQPTTIGANIAQGVGGAAAGLLPMGGAMKGLSLMDGLAGAIGKNAISSVVAHPIATTAADLAAGGYSGVGGAIGDSVSPGNPVAKSIGQILGGAASILSPTQLAMRAGSAGVNTFKKVILPFTESGATVRAAERIQNLVPDAGAAVAALEQPTITNLTPAQMTGDPRLLALQNAVAKNNVSVDNAIRAANEANIGILKNEIGKIRGEGSVADAQQHLGTRQDQFSNLLDERLQAAKDNTDKAVSNLAPEMRSSQASAIARSELESALSDARLQEKHLWNQIPDNILVDKNNTVAAYDNILKATPRAQQEDIPKALMSKVLNAPDESSVRIYNSRGEPMIGDNAPVTERVSELQGLRSKLLEGSRQARADGNFNSARIHDELADAVLNDIGAAPQRVQGEVGQKIRDALDFSRQLNEKFTRGTVGKVLGATRTGGDKVAPELTLGSLLGGGKVKGNVGLQNMLDAADTPELRGSVENYLKDQLSKSVMKDGTLNSSAARKFMDENVDILDKFPDLKQSISRAAESTDNLAAKSTRTQQVQKTLVSDSKNQVSKFINAPIDKEFDVIVASRDPAGFTKDLLNRASKDSTGAAAKGLKASAVDYVLNKSMKGGDLHGETLLANLNNNPKMAAALEQVLTPDEMQRMRRIGGEMKAIQTTTNKDVGGVINDIPSKLIELPIRMLAAGAGAKASKATVGGNGSLVAAGMFSEAAKKYVGSLTRDKAYELLVQAVQDPQLMKALLTSTTTKVGQKAASQKLEAWLLGPGATLLNASESKKNQ